MKITIEEKQNPLNRIYPYLGVKYDNGMVVAFTEPKNGIVVEKASSNRYDRGDFIDAWDESEFTPMHPQPQTEPEPTPVKDRKYPYVGRHNGAGYKVLFTAEKTGMLIDGEYEELFIGDCSDTWNEQNFITTPIPNISRIIIDLE